MAATMPQEILPYNKNGETILGPDTNVGFHVGNEQLTPLWIVKAKESAEAAAAAVAAPAPRELSPLEIKVGQVSAVSEKLAVYRTEEVALYQPLHTQGGR